jgi:hypothetical protein
MNLEYMVVIFTSYGEGNKNEMKSIGTNTYDFHGGFVALRERLDGFGAIGWEVCGFENNGNNHNKLILLKRAK